MTDRASVEPSLAQLLGGRRGALDATIPGLAFAGGWFVAGQLGAGDAGAWAAVHWASAAAGLAAVLLAGWRLRRGHRPRAVLVGLLGVVVAVLPLYATDQVVALGIARAALTWPLVAASVAASWPLVRSALPADHPGIRHPRPGR